MMSTSSDDYCESAERLCATLERIGDALVTLDTATLLETEATLNRLVAVLASSEGNADGPALEPLVARARQALSRCRRLGVSHSSVAKVQLQLCTGIGRYGRDGEVVEAASMPSLKVSA